MNFFKSDKKEQADEELLERYKRTGDTMFFGQLYDRYVSLIYGVCLKYLKEADLAQDTVMDIFEALLGKVSHYEIQTFRTWLYSVVRNHCFQVLKNKKEQVSIDLTSLPVESDLILTLFNEEEEEEDERYRLMIVCLEQLPEPQQVTIRKFFLEELSYAQITEITGFHLKSVKSYLQNGKRNLKICIDKNLNG